MTPWQPPALITGKDKRVERVILCTPDKDLTQCVRGERIVQLNRRKRVTRDEDGVHAKFGVGPASISDYLALVGDTADGYPGLAGWGARSTAAMLARYIHLEAIPNDWHKWGVQIASPRALSETLRRYWSQALLFRDLATLRTDLPVFKSVDQLKWRGATAGFPALAARLDASLNKDGA